MRLADIPSQKNKGKKDNNLDQSQEIDNENDNKEYEQTNETFKQLLNNVENQRNLPSAQLNLKFVKPADRATYLLNYLFM